MTKRTPPFSPGVRERAVRMAQDHKGEHRSLHAAIQSIAAKIGCAGKILSNWIWQDESDEGVRPGSAMDERDRIRALA